MLIWSASPPLNQIKGLWESGGVREHGVGKEELVSVNKDGDMKYEKETPGTAKRRPGMKKTKKRPVSGERTLKP